jgi:hydrogenase maturation protease
VTHPLVIGLGNPLAGDDGIGWHIAERLREEPRLPPGTAVLQGTDLLRLADDLARSSAVFLIDALLDPGEPGRLHVLPVDALDTRDASAHLLSPARAIRLLRGADRRFRDLPVSVLGITIAEVRVGEGLSRPLRDRFPAIIDAIIDAVLAAHPPATGWAGRTGRPDPGEGSL